MIINRKTVNPTFKLDITGKLFLNRDSNIDMKATIIYNCLNTRLNIEKGRLPLFPEIGLKQHLHQMNFNDEAHLDLNIQEFEDDVKNQLGKNCSIDYKLDPDSKSSILSFELEGLKYGVQFKYNTSNNSIKVIDYIFNE